MMTTLLIALPARSRRPSSFWSRVRRRNKHTTGGRNVSRRTIVFHFNKELCNLKWTVREIRTYKSFRSPRLVNIIALSESRALRSLSLPLRVTSLLFPTLPRVSSPCAWVVFKCDRNSYPLYGRVITRDIEILFCSTDKIPNTKYFYITRVNSKFYFVRLFKNYLV